LIQHLYKIIPKWVSNQGQVGVDSRHSYSSNPGSVLAETSCPASDACSGRGECEDTRQDYNCTCTGGKYWGKQCQYTCELILCIRLVRSHSHCKMAYTQKTQLILPTRMFHTVVCCSHSNLPGAAVQWAGDMYGGGRGRGALYLPPSVHREVLPSNHRHVR
jgi:hypothetical protein